MNVRILRIRDVAAKVGLSRSQIYVLADRGQFPKPIMLSENRRGWVESEIDEWLTGRIEIRDQRCETEVA